MKKRFYNSILFINLILVLQGCGQPALKLDELPQGDEAIVVLKASFLHKGKVLYFFDSSSLLNVALDWRQVNNEAVKMEVYSGQYVDGYIAFKIPAGNWYLSRWSAQYSGYEYRYSYSSPTYNSKNHPLSFQVKPGEVVCLGSIEIDQLDQRGGGKFMPVYKLTPDFDEIKKLVQSRYPIIAENLTNRLITKSLGQLRIEQYSVNANTSTLLKDAQNAK